MLKCTEFRPKASKLNELYAARVRQVGCSNQSLFARPEQEAVEIQQRTQLRRVATLRLIQRCQVNGQTPIQLDVSGVWMPVDHVADFLQVEEEIVRV